MTDVKTNRIWTAEIVRIVWHEEEKNELVLFEIGLLGWFDKNDLHLRFLCERRKKKEKQTLPSESVKLELKR